MKLNNRSCVLDAFASVMGWDPKLIALQVGHQGPEGFHTQELIEVALNNGWCVTNIQRSPFAENPETGEVRPINFGKEDAETRFIRHLKTAEGVVLGTNPEGHLHAVAWSGEFAYDYSDDSSFALIIGGKIYSRWLLPETFLRMDRHV